MRAIPFQAFDHLGALYEMLALREAPFPSIKDIPAIGCIVLNDDKQPVAASFLRKIEGGYGMVDGLTSHPKRSSQERHEALDLAIEYCVKMAKEINIQHLVSFCLDKTTVERSERHGFAKQPHSMVTLSIKA